MRLPRDLSGRDLAKALGKLGYEIVRQTGSETAGRLIGANDLLIAAQALALGCIVVTDNEQAFSPVGGLRLENWLRE